MCCRQAAQQALIAPLYWLACPKGRRHGLMNSFLAVKDRNRDYQASKTLTCGSVPADRIKGSPPKDLRNTCRPSLVALIEPFHFWAPLNPVNDCCQNDKSHILPGQHESLTSNRRPFVCVRRLTDAAPLMHLPTPDARI